MIRYRIPSSEIVFINENSYEAVNFYVTRNTFINNLSFLNHSIISFLYFFYFSHNYVTMMRKIENFVM